MFIEKNGLISKIVLMTKDQRLLEMGTKSDISDSLGVCTSGELGLGKGKIRRGKCVLDMRFEPERRSHHATNLSLATKPLIH